MVFLQAPSVDEKCDWVDSSVLFLEWELLSVCVCVCACAGPFGFVVDGKGIEVQGSAFFTSCSSFVLRRTLTV